MISANPVERTSPGRLAGLVRGGRLRPARVLLPLLFLGVAALVAMVPIRRSQTGVAAPTAVANAAPAVQASAETSPAVADKGAGKTVPASGADANPSTIATPDPTMGQAVKGLIAGVSSDVSNLLPISREEEPPPPSPGNPATKVWVNAQGLLLLSRRRFYGKTARGVYMTQREAQSDYYTPALQKNCP